MDKANVSSDVVETPVYEDMPKAFPTFVRSAFNYDTDVASERTGLLCEDGSLTVQSEKEDADINTIVRRFGLTGQLPTNVRVPVEADFTEVFDFQSAMNAIRAAQESFMAMPADVRFRFNNDPERFVAFCTEERDGALVNLDEMRKLGLAVPKAAVAVPEPEPT